MDRLRTALRYGADACYLGATSMSLRNFADNFTLDELREACSMAHDMGRRIYVACNAFARDDDIARLPELLCGIERAGADAVIINDAGVLSVARRTVERMALHLSTQANTLNSEACSFWHEQGISRIILARELSGGDIAHIRANTPRTLELEVFVHGAMCVSYSGRCVLSNYIAGRDSNRGECAQPCRWEYELRERGSEGNWFGIEQDSRGTYILNSRDMNLLGRIGELCELGVDSLKIEGRMKSVAYVATVVNAYRMALDGYAAAAEAGVEYAPGSALAQELENTSHRPFCEGFYAGEPDGGGQAAQSAAYVQDAVIAAVVLGYDDERREALVEQRNRFFEGDVLGILSPGDIGRGFKAEYILDESGARVASAPHPRQRLRVACSERVKEGDILRLRL